MFLDQSPLETVFLSIFEPNLGPSWGHVGTVSDTFCYKKLDLMLKIFLVDFYTFLEPLGPSFLSVSFRREANFQLLVKLLLDVDFGPIWAPTWAQVGLKLGSKEVLKRS